MNLLLNKDCQNYALYLTSAIASFLVSLTLPHPCWKYFTFFTLCCFCLFLAASCSQSTVSKCLTDILGLLFFTSCLLADSLCSYRFYFGEWPFEVCAAECHPLLLSQAEVMRCCLFPVLRFSVCLFARPWLNATKTDWWGTPSYLIWNRKCHCSLFSQFLTTVLIFSN